MSGWTKAEQDAAPEMAKRLHQRILDLEDALVAVLAHSDPLPPDGVDVHVRAQRLLEDRPS